MKPHSLHARLHRALAQAINEDGPAVEVIADPGHPDGARITYVSPEQLPGFHDPLLVVRTSGSTGRAKRTVLSTAAMAASAQATAEFLGMQGQWLLALPVHYIAGISVLTRSLFAGTQPVVMDLSDGFSAQKFVTATAQLTSATKLTSLVPTQLARLLDNPSTETVMALKSYDAILLGGARASKDLLTASRHLGLKIFQTYGSSETAGGLVYNGTALPGVQLRVEEGRILVTGPMLAEGYAQDPQATAEHFVLRDERRWYLTDDLGSVENGKLRIAGRVDDVINTGGVKLSASQVELLLDEFFTQCLVVPVPDAKWGQSVGLAYSGPTDTQDAFEAVRRTISAAAVPKRVLHYPHGLPLLANGKIDRRTIIQQLSSL